MSKYELNDRDLDDLLELVNSMRDTHMTEFNWYKEGFRAGIEAAYRFIEEEGIK